MNTDQMKEERYTPYYELTEVVGGRIGLCVCNDCGAAILISKEEKSQQIHDKWHTLQAPATEK